MVCLALLPAHDRLSSRYHTHCSRSVSVNWRRALPIPMPVGNPPNCRFVVILSFLSFDNGTVVTFRRRPQALAASIAASQTK